MTELSKQIANYLEEGNNILNKKNSSNIQSKLMVSKKSKKTKSKSKKNKKISKSKK